MKVDGMQWDVFCQVIDNYGDAGVCWRLAENLAQRGQRVRFWIDDPAPLWWMVADLAQASGHGLVECGVLIGHNRAIQLLPWSLAEQGNLQAHLPEFSPPDVLIEAFGCEIAPAYLEALQQGRAASTEGWPAEAMHWPQWINLEYLSAEPYVERMHLLQSPVMFGPAQGQSKTFFYPGFTAKTGGLLREPDLLHEQAQFDRMAWRRRLFPMAQQASHPVGSEARDAQWISLFAYEPECLTDWLQQWASGSQPVVVLALAGRSQTWLQQCWRMLGWDWQTSEEAGPELALESAGFAAHKQVHGRLTVFSLAHMSQQQFDHVLWACDCNIVRGEDSLVRALWAGQPFLWHIYPQDDQAHHAKLDAFLDTLQAPLPWRQTMHRLNGIEPTVPASAQAGPPAFDAAPDWPAREAWQQWQAIAQQAKQRLCERADLATALLEFVQSRA